MIITDLLNYVSSIGWIEYQSICELHKPCSNNRLCLERSKCMVINFDKIKDKYCEGGIPKASVDAIHNGKRIFSLIEIKGWNEYIKHNIKNFSESDIEAQIGKYKLDKKLKDSLDIVLAIISDQKIGHSKDFELYPKQYLIVTDISLTKDPLAKLAENLTFLATFSSESNLCWEKTKEFVDNFQTNNLSKFAIKGPYLINCKEVDKYLSE